MKKPPVLKPHFMKCGGRYTKNNCEENVTCHVAQFPYQFQIYLCVNGNGMKNVLITYLSKASEISSNQKTIQDPAPYFNMKEE